MPTDENGYYFGHRYGRATDAWRKSFETPATSAITTGNIGRLAEAAARADDTIRKVSALLADLELRLDALEKRFAPPPVVAPGRWRG